MRAAVLLAFFLPALISTPVAASSPPVVADDAVVAQFDQERLGKSCRRKVRRAYGPVKGRHAGAIRMAEVQRCMANGGRVA